MPSSASRLAAWTLGLLLLVLGTLWPPPADARGKCTVYVFLDARRKPVRTRHQAIVPPAQRHNLISYEDCVAKLDEERALSASAEAGSATLPEALDQRITAGPLRSWLLSFAMKIQGRLVWFVILALVSLATIIGLLVAAFRVSLLWGLLTLGGILFFPPLVIVFIALHWQSAKVPFLVYLACWLAGIGLVVL